VSQPIAILDGMFGLYWFTVCALYDKVNYNVRNLISADKTLIIHVGKNRCGSND